MPILIELRAFVDETMAKISGKSNLAGTIRYMMSRWAALTRYIDDVGGALVPPSSASR